MGLTKRGKCTKQCEKGVKGLACSCPKVWSYYVEFYVRDDGKALTLAQKIPGAKLKRWKVGSPNKTLARQQEAIIKTDLMKGVVKSPHAISRPFGQWGEEYLKLEAVKALSTYKDRVDSVRQQLIPFFGKKSLAEITPTDVEAFREQRVLLHRKKAPAIATINADHATLKHMFSIAERRGLVLSNPAKRVPLPDPGNERDRVLSAEEWTRLHSAAVDHLKPILLIAYQLGMRWGEIMSLTWDCVDLQRGFLRVLGAKCKTGEGRTIPLTPEIRDMFNKLAKVRHLNTNNVFLYEGEPIQRVKRSFMTACRNAGMTNLRFHDLRHCAATNLRRAGVDTVTAMKIVGHKSEKMHRRYNTVSEEDLTRAAGKLNTYLSNTALTPPESSHQHASASA